MLGSTWAYSEGGGAEAPWSPAKMTSEPQDLKNYLQWRPRPAFWLQLAFISTKNLILKNSQHDEIVQNTLTFCIKKEILIEIKGLYFVFLNFTNSLNCEELLQFCIKIDKFYIILQGSHIQIKQYQWQFTRHCSFCEILLFVILLYA